MGLIIWFGLSDFFKANTIQDLKRQLAEQTDRAEKAEKEVLCLEFSHADPQTRQRMIDDYTESVEQLHGCAKEAGEKSNSS